MAEKIFSMQEIRDMTYSDVTYRRGKALFQEGRVGMFSKNQDVAYYWVTVKGTKNYIVTLEFDEEHFFETAECTCPAFDGYMGICKHIVAAMMAFNEQSPGWSNQRSVRTSPSTGALQSDTRPQYDYDETLELVNRLGFELFRGNESFEKEPIRVEYALYMDTSYQRNRYSLRLRVGAEQLYQVKDCEGVIGDILDGTTIVFGKKFTFSSVKHILSVEDQDIFRYLRQITEASSVTSRYDYRSAAEKKEILIPASFLQGLLTKLSQTPLVSVQIGYGNEPTTSLTNIEIIKDFDRLPLTFSLSELPQGGYLFTDDTTIPNGDIEPLMDADILMLHGKFYFMDKSMTDRLVSVYSAVYHSREKGLRIPPEGAADFLTIAAPAMQEFLTITIPDEVKSKYKKYPLQAQLYLDWKQEKLLMEIYFVYGDTKIDVIQEVKAETSTSPQGILRDVIAERKAMALFMAAGGEDYNLVEDLFLSDLDAVSMFLYEGVEKLSSTFEIFLTEAVQQLLYEPVRPPKVAIEVNKQSRLLDVTFSTEDITVSDLRNMVKQMVHSKKYYRLSNGKIIDLRQQEFTELTDAITQLDFPLKDLKKEMSLPLYKAFAVDGEAAIVHQGEGVRTLLDRISQPKNIDFPLPDIIEAQLRPYQETGYRWLKGLDYYGLGGILADDMGLGKTLQVITFIASTLKEETKPFLVLCPSSVLYNWQKEFRQFAPSVETTLITGTKGERRELVDAAAKNQIPVWITSYPLLQRDQDLYEAYAFKTVILDEAQSVKNATAKTTKVVSSLSARNKIALSGTPIENALSELYTLFSLVQPGLFGSQRDFKQMDVDRVAEKAKPFILRRLKTDVLKDLPPKIESIEYIDLTEKQKTIYLSQLQLMRQETKEMLDTDTLNENRIKILAGLTRLRQICCDPSLVMEGYEGDSGKLNRLLEYLEEAKENGKRVVLFSQFTQMLSIIRKKLDAKGADYFYLDGQTPNRDRLELTTRFNEGEKDLFLISLKAGGTGLNLTGGDTVILYDSWWNPAVESQATDRVHRFGQKKVVQVIRMIATGTIEERINELQAQKRELIDSVIQSGGESVTALSKEELMKLLDI